MFSRMTRIALSLVLAALPHAASLAALPAAAASVPPTEPPALWARSAILVDQATGRVLFAHNADQPFVPASLAKLMSLHIIYQKLADRYIRRDDVVSLTNNALAENQAPGSSLMNLKAGQIVTVEELMKGMAVASGNDAATALAEYAEGSVSRFVRAMNEEAEWLGYTITRFTDPSGVGADNRVTAREFADFCRRYIELHPQALEELHSLREFDFPLPQNMPDGRLSSQKTRKQYNGNYLVWDDFGVDGLKTGHLDDDNFTAAVTARRGDMRLIAVLLGVPGRSLTDGARNRADDSMAILSYGFRNFATVEPVAPVLKPVRVWKGASPEVAVEPAGPIRLTVGRDELAALQNSVVMDRTVIAPVSRGQKIGEIVYSAGGGEVGRISLVAAEEVERAGLLRRAWDTVLMGLSALVGGMAAAFR